MRIALSLAVILAVGLLHSSGLGPRAGVPEVWATKPPPAEVRQKAEATHEKEIKAKIEEQRKSGCPYGKDKATGKCYEPREGQFYRDSKTGEVHRKKTECINLPWKPCKGGAKVEDTKAKKKGDKEKEKEKGQKGKDI